MRVTKNSKGEFIVDDEPMRLTGKAAKQVIDALERGATSEQHKRFLAECEREYIRGTTAWNTRPFPMESAWSLPVLGKGVECGVSVPRTRGSFGERTG